MAYGGKWWLPIPKGKYKRSVTLPKVKEKVQPGRASGSSTPQGSSPTPYTFRRVGDMEDNIHLLLIMSDSEVKERVMPGWTRRKERVMPGWTKRPYDQSWGNCPRGPKLKNGGNCAPFLNFGPKRPYVDHVFVLKPTAPQLSYCDFSP
jgi:hypothetical protein